MVALFFNLTAIGSVFEFAGSAGAVAIPASSVLTILLHHDKEGFQQFGLSYGSTMATVFALKPIVNEKRPDGGKWSFPSGHTASAFAGAVFLQRRYGWNYGAPAYVASWLVGLSRLYSNHHRPQDVLAGAMIGIAANLVFTKPYSHTHFQPLLLKHGAGMQLSFY